VSFSNEDDIRGLRLHEGYFELKPENPNGNEKETHETDENADENARQEVLIPKVKLRGRPRKEK
jgi:hypothetical protein